jgi:hypothetical protein
VEGPLLFTEEQSDDLVALEEALTAWRNSTNAGAEWSSFGFSEG